MIMKLWRGYRRLKCTIQSARPRSLSVCAFQLRCWHNTAAGVVDGGGKWPRWRGCFTALTIEDVYSIEEFMEHIIVLQASSCIRPLPNTHNYPTTPWFNEINVPKLLFPSPVVRSQPLKGHLITSIVQISVSRTSFRIHHHSLPSSYPALSSRLVLFSCV